MVDEQQSNTSYAKRGATHAHKEEKKQDPADAHVEGGASVPDQKRRKEKKALKAILSKLLSR